MSTAATSFRPFNKSGWSKLIARAMIEAQSRFSEIFETLLEHGLPTTPGELYDFERRVHNEVSRDCVDRVVGEVVRAAHTSTEVGVAASELVGQYSDLRLQKSLQDVTIRLFGGSTVTVSTPYFLSRRDSVPLRKREEEGNGVYPRLAALGIHYRVSPALAAEVGRLVALGPIEQAMDGLALRGVVLDIKTVQRLAQRLGERALRYRAWLTDRENQRAIRTTWGKGLRIVFAVDGGRLRTRVAKQMPVVERGKRRGFVPKWREPKVLVVYAIDEKGRKMKKSQIYYDATMGDADDAFNILAALLLRIGADEAKEWVVVADGAAWIWNRIAALTETVGFSMDRVTEVVDFYHACEHLHEVADAIKVKGWRKKQRAAWYYRMRRLLREGAVDSMLEEARRLCPPPVQDKEKHVPDPLEYFFDHTHRMQYADYRDRCIPIGSGAVESAVRRIVNLRLKSNGTFWDLYNAEVVLHLRSQLLSGHWETFVKTVLDHEAFWAKRRHLPEAAAIAA